jgi:hypothetical protein
MTAEALGPLPSAAIPVVVTISLTDFVRLRGLALESVDFEILLGQVIDLKDGDFGFSLKRL